MDIPLRAEAQSVCFNEFWYEKEQVLKCGVVFWFYDEALS